MTISAKQVKELRQLTGAGFLDCRQALEKADGDFDQAKELLIQKGLAKAAKRASRDASEGILELYSHGQGRVGVMVEVNCETDFVARSGTFQKFAHEIALQIAAADPRWISEEDIPEDVINYERKNARIRYLDEGKPENIVDRIVDGVLTKFKKENCLMLQDYIRDEDLTIEKLLHKTIASLGENILIRRFERWEVGESSAS